MKLTPEQIAFIINVVKTAVTLDMDSVIIEPERVRGVNESITVIMLHNEDVLDMPSNCSVGISRLKTFVDRYDIAKTRRNFTIDIKVNEIEKYAQSLTMKGEGIKVDYRCASPTKIRAPRRINDEPVLEVELTPETVVMIGKAHTAMKEEEISIIGNNGVSFEIPDITNDVFSYKFADEVTTLDPDANTMFAHRYPIKVLLSVFRQNQDEKFRLTPTGILILQVNNLTIYIPPRV